MSTQHRILTLALVLFSARAFAADGAKPAPLVPLANDKLLKLAPLLRTNDIALIESNDKGELKQLTTISYAAASPEELR
jgi:hypothetical protein